MRIMCAVAFVVGLLMLTGDETRWPGVVLMIGAMIAYGMTERWGRE